ncbi:putative uncharacterized protein DDB_G0282499 [Condylostylus longicornis]|uniref:putative uncharacterized protein DDB_G0282499 n=1 Tax=Condylostylus longicornis TaxID=2530218 RepID=UPI00244E4E54|nr:putative uncharacterized protein DDB_G0282499 [Condylostylus longicornis]
MTVKITSFLPSIPSYSTNMITSRRDHPFNKSTRPLLMERKPQLLLKKKIINFNDNNSINSNNGNTKLHHGFNDFDDIMSQQFNRNINTHIGYPYGSPPPSPTITGTATTTTAINNSNGNTINNFRFSDDITTTTTITNNGINNLGISSINTIFNNDINYQNLNHNQQQQQQNQLESLPKPYPPSACDEDNFFPSLNNDNQTLPISNRITEQYNNNWNINNRRQHKQNQYQQQEQHQYENQFSSSRILHHNFNNTNNFQSNFQNIGNNIKKYNNDNNDNNTINDNNYDDINNYENSGPFIFGVHDKTNFNYKNSTITTTSTTPTTTTTNNIRNNNTVINSSNRRNFFNKNKKDKTVAFNQTNSDTSSSSKEGDKESKFLVKCRRKLSKRDHTDDDNDNKNKKQGKEKYQPNIKCVLVGDGAVGKTNLIVSYLENRFIAEHVPTASDIYNAEVMVNDNPVDVCLCDTAGQDTLDPLRELCYPDSDVFLLCFSVVKPDTFNSIKIKWAPKFSKSKAALILVGTQADLRSDIHVLNKLQTQGEKPISFTDACDFATSIGSKYIETSSLTQDKIKDVFDAAIWDALLPNHLPPKPPLWKRLLCLA